MKLPSGLCSQLALYQSVVSFPQSLTRSICSLNLQKKHYHLKAITPSYSRQNRFCLCNSACSVRYIHRISEHKQQLAVLPEYGLMKRRGVEGTYIALGSNIENRVQYIEAACRELSHAGLRVLRTSCLYETKPMYVEDQGSFLNAVCQVGIL